MVNTILWLMTEVVSQYHRLEGAFVTLAKH